ncbi:hypothetical protein [Pseudomonas psychrophila]|uniref:Uncharacterized protein n=1 Tax=Pseudomonas psychrophila TaxID=122355 RepID=A0A8I1FS44_9PSED|nr:hypothetical protein [Pseudomonas psychrophila]AVX93341.1 hypothetical protein PkP19E3_35200 [Pseudomonas koreensis]MBJ2259702.1 hypothetical protein [Pseudomonas psychrophila]
MNIQKELHGKASGSVLVDGLIERLRHLSRETVNIDSPDFEASGPIVEQWDFDGEHFDVRFSQLAVDFFQTADDPRRELIAVLFNEIG